MSAWIPDYTDHAKKDLAKLDGSQRGQVLKAIEKVSENPLPNSEGGLGKPLGSHNTSNLTGYLKIKLLKLGLRVVYRLVRENHVMKIVVISVRDDDTVYIMAKNRER
ncbi:MAG: type II toxin-antitoxin system RelE/ParE family toxin [Eubacteriales bacterium]